MPGKVFFSRLAMIGTGGTGGHRRVRRWRPVTAINSPEGLNIHVAWTKSLMAFGVWSANSAGRNPVDSAQFRSVTKVCAFLVSGAQLRLVMCLSLEVSSSLRGYLRNLLSDSPRGAACSKLSSRCWSTKQHKFSSIQSFLFTHMELREDSKRDGWEGSLSQSACVEIA